MKTSPLFTKILIFLIFSSIAYASQPYPNRERVIICMLPIQYADAEQLAATLTPFLSPQGKIGAYSPTNTLIIKDQPSVVKMFIKVIKGKPDLSECQNIEDDPEPSHQIPSD